MDFAAGRIAVCEHVGPFGAHAPFAWSNPDAHTGGVRRVHATINFLRANLESDRISSW
jgi:hypothetical protein